MKLEITLNREQFVELQTALAAILGSFAGIVLNTARIAESTKTKEEQVLAKKVVQTESKAATRVNGWTEEEDRIVLENFGKKSNREIAYILLENGHKRTPNAVKTRYFKHLKK